MTKKSKKKIDSSVIGFLALLVAAGAGGYILAPNATSIDTSAIPSDCFISIDGEKIDCREAVDMLNEQAQRNSDMAQVNEGTRIMLESRSQNLTEIERANADMQVMLENKAASLEKSSQQVSANVKMMLERQMQGMICLNNGGEFIPEKSECKIGEDVWKWNGDTFEILKTL